MYFTYRQVHLWSRTMTRAWRDNQIVSAGQEAAPANVFVCYFHISNQFLQRGSYKPIRERCEEKEGKMLVLTLHIHTLL